VQVTHYLKDNRGEAFLRLEISQLSSKPTLNPLKTNLQVINERVLKLACYFFDKAL
jgi:hypothetical protein